MSSLPPPRIQRVADGVHLVRIPGGAAHLLNAYVHVERAGVTLIDTGWAHSAPHIESALHALGVDRSAVRRIILTHFHDDHAGAAAEIASWGDVEVIAGAADAPFITGNVVGPLPTLTPAEVSIHPPSDRPPQAGPCPVHHVVNDGEVLDFAGGVQVISVPGHTPGSIALHFTALDVVLTGDAIAEFNGDVILGVFNTDRTRARESQAKLAGTRANIAGFGHGEPVLTDASQRIARAQDPFSRGVNA